MVDRTELVKSISKALEENDRTAEYKIGVAENQGVVTLTGEVPTVKVKEAAESIAKAHEGVIQVINDLSVEELREERGREDADEDIPYMTPPVPPTQA